MDDYQNLESQFNETSMNSQSRSFKIRFSTGVASPVFTGKKITGNGDSNGNDSIEITLIDSQTHQKVDASAKVKLVLLPKDFCDDIWTPLEFKNNVVTEWKNKKNLLQGDTFLILEHGSGIIGEIKIKHDRHYLSKVQFRLGAMVVDWDDEVEEAITDPFEVKDRRNELTSKNHRLRSTDKVWQLKNIGRNGPIRKRLEGKNIKTVKGFLDMLSSNPSALEKIYGSNGKKWETTIRHAETAIRQAETCTIDKVVNNVYRSTESTFQGQNNMTVVHYVPSNDSHNLNVGLHNPCASWQVFPMIIDQGFSIQDMDHDQYASLEMVLQHEDQGIKPCQTDREDGPHHLSSSIGVKCVLVRKRWTKLYRVWLSMRSFTKKVGGGVRVRVPP